MKDTPSPQQWPSRLFGAALCLLFAAIAISAALQVLATIVRPLVVIGSVGAVVWLVLVLRGRASDRW